MGVNVCTQDDGRYSVSQFTSVNYSRTSSENSCVCVPLPVWVPNRRFFLLFTDSLVSGDRLEAGDKHRGDWKLYQLLAQRRWLLEDRGRTLSHTICDASTAVLVLTWGSLRSSEDGM